MLSDFYFVIKVIFLGRRPNGKRIASNPLLTLGGSETVGSGCTCCLQFQESKRQDLSASPVVRILEAALDALEHELVPLVSMPGVAAVRSIKCFDAFPMPWSCARSRIRGMRLGAEMG